MKPSRVDRLAVTWVGAVLVLWTACLVILWAWALESSGVSTLLATTASLLAVSFVIGLPGRAARAVRRLLERTNVQNELRIELETVHPRLPGPREGRAMMRLLGSGAVFSAACGLASTALVYSASFLADALAEGFSLSPALWLAMEFLIQFVCMLPIALGIAVSFLISAMVRTAPPGDLFATACRDWLWATAAGLTAFALAWWVGVHLLALSLGLAVALAGAALILFQRQDVSPRTRPVVRPIVPLPQRTRIGFILLTFACLSLVLTVQMRLLGDVAGAGMTAKALWAAVSVALLASFLRRTDRRPRMPGRTTVLAAMIGLAAGAMIQSALAVACGAAYLTGRSVVATAVCGAVAAGIQPALAAMTATVVSRQRRQFARGGGQARTYVAAATCGLALGLVAYLLIASVSVGRFLLPAMGLGLLTAALLGAIARMDSAPEPMKWAGSGAVLMCCLAVVMLLSLAQMAGPAIPGVWLSSLLLPHQRGGSAAKVAMLPYRRTSRSAEITGALESILSGEKHRGRWWIVASSRANLPPVLPQGLRPFHAAADPSALPDKERTALRAPESVGGFLAEARANRDHFDGVLLAPLRADHPQAWRCYNERALRHCFVKVRPGGVMAVRTQVDRDRPGEFVAAAKAFHRAVGSGWAAIAVADRQIDVLLAGPGEIVAVPIAQGALAVVDLEDLSRRWPEVGTLRLVHPPGRAVRRLGEARFHDWLRNLRK